MPEGTIFFPQEPVIRVTASIIEAQLIESYLLNTLNLQTMIASKASRVVSAAQGRGVYDFSLRRTHGRDAGIKVARASYLAGFGGTSNVFSSKRYGIPVVGTMAHAFVMAFKTELESFLAYGTAFPERTILLVDTYDTVKGIGNAILAGLELKKKGHRLRGIRLDSGDMVALSKTARKMLDTAGLEYVKIFASGDLDEFKIKELLSRGARIDNFGVGTRMGVSVDAPYLDVIYKISEVSDENGEFLPTMKLSKDKTTYPGRKQVFRLKNKKGNYEKDIVALEHEKNNGRLLLKKVVQRGKILYSPPPLHTMRDLLQAELDKFPGALREITGHFQYPVVVSAQLEKLAKGLSFKLSKSAG
jgi:nicotinate phosphoribosyltransferase